MWLKTQSACRFHFTLVYSELGRLPKGTANMAIFSSWLLIRWVYCTVGGFPECEYLLKLPVYLLPTHDKNNPSALTLADRITTGNAPKEGQRAANPKLGLLRITSFHCCYDWDAHDHRWFPEDVCPSQNTNLSAVLYHMHPVGSMCPSNSVDFYSLCSPATERWSYNTQVSIRGLLAVIGRWFSYPAWTLLKEWKSFF